MEKTVIIDGKEVRMRASALIPRLYRFKFGRDMIADMQALATKYAKIQDKGEQLSVLDLTVFENLAWLFCKHADDSIPDTPEEWLDNMDGMFSVYEVLPQMLELWTASSKTTAKPAKK